MIDSLKIKILFIKIKNLNESLKFNVLFFVKKGFSTIHVASIHGRQNILQFLIEEKSIDPNFPSGHGWRPIHLCISNQTGERAIRCLRYLVQKGADINA